MRVKQALVAGGRMDSGSRLGLFYPKPLIMYKGKPLIYYTMLALKEAGIRKVIIAASDERLLSLYKSVLDKKILKELKITYFRDAGVGMRRLPSQLREQLEEQFFLVTGHTPPHPETLREMENAFKKGEFVACSYPSRLRKLQEQLIGRVLDEYYSSPYIFTRDFVNILESHDFSFKRVMAGVEPGVRVAVPKMQRDAFRNAVEKYAEIHGKVLVVPKMPREFDYGYEFREAERRLPGVIKCINRRNKTSRKR